MSLKGFDCEFKTPAPSRSKCPICLLIIRNPYQALCCGKSFCKACLETLMFMYSPCPTCKCKKLDIFPDKGLLQDLRDSVVFCTYKDDGCEWFGELEQLDKHLNSTPKKDTILTGCPHIEVICDLCYKPCKRSQLEKHQNSECSQRLFTCQLCQIYTSTFEEVKASHELSCDSRPMECPNSCGASCLQHQHLEEHVSSQCPLSEIACVFKEYGCSTKLLRKDLPSHLADNIIAHVSDLASETLKTRSELKAENEKLAKDLETLKSENVSLRQQLETMESRLDNCIINIRKNLKTSMNAISLESEHLKSCFRVPPVDFALTRLSSMEEGEIHIFEPFYSKFGGCCLQLRIQVFFGENTITFQASYDFVAGAFPVTLPCTFYVTTLVVDQVDGFHHTLDHLVTSSSQGALNFVVKKDLMTKKFVKNDCIFFRVSKVEYR